MSIVDTSGWLAYFADSPQAPHFAAAIEDTEHLLVLTVVVCEVFRKITLAFDENRALRAVAHLKQGRGVDLDEATAILHSATVYTLDAHFEGLAQVRTFAKAAAGRPRR